MKFKLVIFDLDDTLVDFRNLEKDAFSAALSLCKMEEHPDHYEQFRAINRSYWERVELNEITPTQVIENRGPHFLRECIPRPPDGISPEKFTQEYVNFLMNTCNLLPNSLEVLDALRKRNVELLLISNGLEEIQMSRLAHTSLGDFFPRERIMISSTCGIFKPRPEIFEKALAQANLKELDKDSILIVGDSLLSDIQGGQNFGIKTCWFNAHGKLKTSDNPCPDYEICSLLDVLQIIDS